VTGVNRQLVARTVATWALLMAVEVAHGTARELFLAPRVGDFRARQIAVFTGSLLIVGITIAAGQWMQREVRGTVVLIGAAWAVLTLGFEIGLGWLAFGYRWDRIAADYNPFEGGLMPIGLSMMATAPLLARHVHRIHATRSGTK
jgi:hypothetical protein